MSTDVIPPAQKSYKTVVGALLLGIVGLLIGLYGSIFGPFYVMIVGFLLAVWGVIGIVRKTRPGRSVTIFGAAIIVGALLYIAIGVFTPDGASSGCVPDKICAAW